MLASRPREILQTLISSTHPVTVRELANRFRVSSRTVKYDLESIRDFLKTKGIQLHSRPNIGLWVGDRQNSPDMLAELLFDARRESVLSRNERVNYIIAWLLLREGYSTFGGLAEELLVSRNTVIADIKHVEQNLMKWEVSLVRQIRYGIRVEASELKRRRAAEHNVLEILNATDVFRIIQNVLSNGKDKLDLKKLGNLFLLPMDDLLAILQAMIGFTQDVRTHGLYLADRDIIGVFIRVCIAVSRNKHAAFKGIVFENEVTSDVERLPFAGLVFNMLDALSGRLEMQFFETDPVYVGLYIGAEVSDTISTLTITRRLVENLTRQMGIPFQQDSVLFDNLMAHLDSCMPRLRNGIPELNPLTSEITRNYEELFRNVKLACEKVFSKEGINPENSDIAFLVLHFAASLERMVGEMNYTALVVCSTGRGNAQFIKSFFENEVRHLKVVSCCSVNEVASVLQSNPVDLVVTALPVVISDDVPVVRVGHLPTKEDVANVYAKLSQLKCRKEMYKPNTYRSAQCDSPKTSGDCNTKNGRDVEQNIQYEQPLGYSYSRLTGTEFVAKLPKEVLESLEHFSHDIIIRGFELSHLVIERFRNYLTEESAVGLTLHILLMVNRLAFNDPYMYSNLSMPWEVASSSLRDGLKELMRERNIDIPESEVEAILKYFSESH